MLQKVKRAVDRFVWNIKPRVYVCQDVVLIKWMQNEFIIPRLKKGV